MFPLFILFLLLYGAYLGTSEWSGFDPRYPFYIAAGLFVVAVTAAILGYFSTANTYTTYAVVMLAGALALVPIHYLRSHGRFPFSLTSRHSLVTSGDSSAFPPR